MLVLACSSLVPRGLGVLLAPGPALVLAPGLGCDLGPGPELGLAGVALGLEAGLGVAPSLEAGPGLPGPMGGPKVLLASWLRRWRVPVSGVASSLVALVASSLVGLVASSLESQGPGHSSLLTSSGPAS